jgi:hypothetical protein
MPLSGNAQSNFEKLPTFREYCKAKGQEAEKSLKVVTVVWFPNQFPNFTLDTESFRLRINCQEDDSIETTDFLESAIEQEQVLAIRVTDAKKLAYEVDVLPNESGTWEKLGSNGYKCTVNERKSVKKPRVSKSQQTSA